MAEQWVRKLNDQRVLLSATFVRNNASLYSIKISSSDVTPASDGVNTMGIGEGNLEVDAEFLKADDLPETGWPM